MRRKAQHKRCREVQKLLDNNSCIIPSESLHIVDNYGKSTQKNQKSKTGLRDIVANITAIIRGKKETKGEYTVGTFSFLLLLLFKSVGGLGMFSTVIAGIYDVIAIITYVAQGNVDVGILFYYFFVLGLLILFFLYSVMVWGAANEIEKETDKNYVLAVFSGVVSLASLIVAIATFLRG